MSMSQLEKQLPRLRMSQGFVSPLVDSGSQLLGNLCVRSFSSALSCTAQNTELRALAGVSLGFKGLERVRGLGLPRRLSKLGELATVSVGRDGCSGHPGTAP